MNPSPQETFTSQTLPTLLFVTAVLSFLLFISYKIFLAFRPPLSKVPGPILSRFTTLPLKIQTLLGRRIHHIHALHDHYGPVVRVSPHEVSIASPPAAKQIHKVSSAFPKTKWYTSFTQITDRIFAMTDRKQHAARRRLLAHPLSESGLRVFEAHVKSRIELAVARIGEEMKVQGYADVMKWFYFLATDVIGDLSFGEGFNMLEFGQKNQYAKDLEKTFNMSTLASELPQLSKLFSYAPFLNDITAVKHRIYLYAQQSIRRLYSNVNHKPTLFTRIAAAKEKTPTGESGLPPESIQAEALGYIIAGSDTTAITLTYLIYILAKHPRIQTRLCAEVTSLPAAFTNADVKPLPYLHQILHEALRLYGAAPGSLPRLVPPEGFQVEGHTIPGGMTVSTQAYTLHRDPAVFPDPHAFRPERWADPTQEMRDSFMAFGGASRYCIGVNLAMMELRMTAACLYRAFPRGLEIAMGEGGGVDDAGRKTGMSDEDMEIRNFFVIMPKGHRCLVRPL